MKIDVSNAMTLPDVETERDDISVDKERYKADNVTVHHSDTVDTGGEPTPFSAVKGRRATLADLIGVCRVKGLQIFNNVPNIPESEKIRIAEERERERIAAERERAMALERERESRREGYELSSDGGRSAGSHMTVRTDRKWENRSARRSSRSRRSTRSKLERFDEDGSTADTNGYESLNHMPNGRHSLVPKSPAMSARSLALSQLTSRSSMRSKQDIPDDLADIDAEEILQRRMRRRSRRHRESIDILVTTMSSKAFEPARAPKDTKLQTINDEEDVNLTHTDNTTDVTGTVNLKSDNSPKINSINSGDRNGDNAVAKANLETTKSKVALNESSTIKTEELVAKQKGGSSDSRNNFESDNKRVEDKAKHIADSVVYIDKTATETVEDTDGPRLASTPKQMDKTLVNAAHEDNSEKVSIVRKNNDTEQSPIATKSTNDTKEDPSSVIRTNNDTEENIPRAIKATNETEEIPSAIIENNETEKETASANKTINETEEETPSANKTTNETEEDTTSANKATHETEEDTTSANKATNETEEDTTSTNKATNETEEDTPSENKTTNETEEHTTSANKATNETEEEVIKELVIQDGDATLILYNTRKQSTLTDNHINHQDAPTVKDEHSTSPSVRPDKQGDSLDAIESGDIANNSHAPSRLSTATSKSGSIKTRDTDRPHVASRSTDEYNNIDKAALSTGLSPHTLSEESTEDGTSPVKTIIKNANDQKAENHQIVSPRRHEDEPVNNRGTGYESGIEIDTNSGGTLDLSYPQINRSYTSKHNENPTGRKSVIGDLITNEQLGTYNNEDTSDRRSYRNTSGENIDGDKIRGVINVEKQVNGKEPKMADVDITDNVTNGKIISSETTRSKTPAESVKSVKSVKSGYKQNGVIKKTHNDSYDSDVIDAKTRGDGEHEHTDGRTVVEQSSHADISSRQTKQSNKTVGSSGSTTSGKSIKTMSSEARMILLMTRLRQTYDEENESQSNYITELSHTREELRREYENLRNYDGLLDFEPRQEVKKEKKEPPKESNKQLDESFEHVINEVVKVQVSTKPKESANVEKPVEVEQSEEFRSHEYRNHAPLKAREKIVIDSDWTPPANVDKKVDCRWDPEHPMYKEIQTGFKSKSKLPNTRRLQMELKRLNKKTFSTGNIPPNNVYLIEAKRRYPSGFHGGDNSSSGNVNKKAKVATSSPKTGSDSPYNQPLVLDSKLHHRNLQRAKRREQAQNKNKRSTSDNVESDTTATGASNSPGPIRKRPTRRYVKTRSDSVDSGEERLHRDKKTVEEYQHYIDNKTDLPVIRDGNKRVAKSNGNKLMNGSANKVPTELPQLRFDSNKPAMNETHSRIKSKRAAQKSGNSASEPGHVTSRDTNGYDGDESDINSKGSTASKPGSTKQSTGKSSDIPIGNAVDIVQSRQKFYTKNTVERENQREHRVLKLFRDLQEIRRKAELREEITPSDDTDISEDKEPGFLVMKYDSPRTVDLTGQKNDLALKRFLHDPLEYEICSKGPPLHLSQKKREKALDMIQQKVYNRLKGNHRVK